MLITVKRQQFTAKSTIGELFVDGDFECFTLEDMVRPVKIKGVTAIPAGTYEVVVNMSARFNRLLPLLLNVPNFDGVRIHTGNTDADTEGCLLVGQTRQTDFIGNSRAAFDQLFPKIQAAAQREKVFIEITEESAPSLTAALPMARAAKSVRRQTTAAPAKKAAKKAGKNSVKSAKAR